MLSPPFRFRKQCTSKKLIGFSFGWEGRCLKRQHEGHYITTLIHETEGVGREARPSKKGKKVSFGEGRRHGMRDRVAQRA